MLGLLGDTLRALLPFPPRPFVGAGFGVGYLAAQAQESHVAGGIQIPFLQGLHLGECGVEVRSLGQQAHCRQSLGFDEAATSWQEEQLPQGWGGNRLDPGASSTPNHPVRSPRVCLESCMRLHPILLILPLLPRLAAQEPARPLKPGSPVLLMLGPGQPHRAAFQARKGEFLKVLAAQKGVDIVLSVFGPDGKKLAEVDSPNGTYGPEAFAFEAPLDGAYRVELACLDSAAKPGACELSIPYLLSPKDYASHRLVDLTKGQMEALRGNYEVAPGRVILVGIMGGAYAGGGKALLVYEDLGTRRMGLLHPTSPSACFRGTTVMEPFPAEGNVTFTFGPDGRAAGLQWQEADGRILKGKRVDPFRFEEVSIPSGPLTLKGYLMMPAGRGPCPVVVYAHGSQGCTRDVGVNGNFFVRHGVGLLSFDKRGAGESSGNWQSASLQDLAGDVLAGVAWLKARPDVDPKRIGVWGISQGGWLSSIAAATSRDVAFQISQVGSGVPVWENMVHEKRSDLRAAGLSGPALEEACAFTVRVYRRMSEGCAPAEVHAMAKAEAGKPWMPEIGLAQAPAEHYFWNWMKLNGSVDSIPYLKQVKVPVLWLLGDRDSQVPTEQSLPRLQDALAANKQATLKVLSPANHGMMECGTGLSDEFVTLRSMAPGYRETLGAWLDAVVLRKKTPRP